MILSIQILSHYEQEQKVMLDWSDDAVIYSSNLDKIFRYSVLSMDDFLLLVNQFLVNCLYLLPTPSHIKQ